MISKVLVLGAYLAALLSVLLGIFCFSSLPMHLGFWRFLASRIPVWVGLTPAFHYGIPWKYTWQEWREVNLTGKVAIVTGANSGIGYDLASALASAGASVSMVCRSEMKCQAARSNLLKETSSSGSGTIVKEDSIKTMIMDTATLASVRAFVETYRKEYRQENIDLLFMNAGTNYLPGPDDDPKCAKKTKQDGLDYLFQVNYLGHHLMYRLLEPLLNKNARIIQTSSAACFSSYKYKVATDLETLHGCSESFMNARGDNLAYGQSKLAQILWAKAVTRQNRNVIASAFHPGLVDTPILGKILDSKQAEEGAFIRRFFDWLRAFAWKSPDGALTGLYLAVAPEEQVRGKYYHPQAQEVVNPLSLDEKLQDDLWDFSEELVKDYLSPIDIREVAEDPVQEEETPSNHRDT